MYGLYLAIRYKTYVSYARIPDSLTLNSAYETPMFKSGLRYVLLTSFLMRAETSVGSSRSASPSYKF